MTSSRSASGDPVTRALPPLLAATEGITMELWKTMTIGAAAAVLVGVTAVSPAMAAPVGNADAAAVAAAASLASGNADATAVAAAAASIAQEISSPGARTAQPLSVPGYELVQTEDRTVSYRIVEGSETPAPARDLTFSNNDGAPLAASLEIRYQAGSGEFVEEVSPLVQPGGPSWRAVIPGDARDVDIQVHAASGAIVAERS